ncbi:NPCBM/NEW2 domain-containing protein [Streptomyces sp. LX-29]|uniref:NPCBM/NEW2 domain-containing protein n=1 Tax=Streptomyces sp. LX-29 TaxID=2900152 RepID=UPI00240D0A7F|nr:NPCBM/NEW2 domain-containing protein [Streptomyces sp. LX-29]WFB06415.1 NPCBM/NEW2 domain-containing protein [Streptomyces sp. LX-29]
MRRPCPRTSPPGPGGRNRPTPLLGALAAALLCGTGLAAAPAATAAPARTPDPGPAPAARQDAAPARHNVTSARQDAAAAPPAASAPGDGLALTPPMGFNNWNSTHCRAEFNEAMIKGIADIFVARGLKEAGYEYVNIDDCWALPRRDANGKLVPDPVRFPHGIKAVADYVHSKGLKFGIYTSAGTKTCDVAGFPGGLGHERSDAQQFADWGVDYLKYDNCNNQGVDAKQRYTAMRDALKAASQTTGRPIVFSLCEWGENRPWEWARDVGHLWRTTGDISDNWSSMVSIMKRNLPLARYAGPGHWNDPDMLEVGNGGMTPTEYRTHFSMWSIMAAPLLIGSDLRTADEEAFRILGNREVIAVDQDPLGKQGTVRSSTGGRWVVAKEMADGSRAVALFNESGTARRISTTAQEVGLPADTAYQVRDLWQHRSYHSAGAISATVPAHGTVLVRVWPDRAWADYPPAVELGLDEPPLTEPGTPVEVTTTVTNLGRAPARQVSTRLTAPQGWTVRPLTPTTARTLAAGRALTITWSVTPPKGTPVGGYDLDVTSAYRSVRGTPAQAELPVQGRVAVPPPAGHPSLSDLDWLLADNGWGPVEKNTSVGESRAGDGSPITIGGTVYAKGLGAHAPSSVEYYAGGRCERVTAQVGVDDEKESNGSVTFEIWADGRKVAGTGVLTTAMPAQPLSADVTGARLIRLVVTDAGDGINSDHADWADARLSCAGPTTAR